MPTDHVDAIMGKWREEAERGRLVDPEALLESHPEHAEELADRFAAQALVDHYYAEADSLPLVTPEQIGDYRIVGEIGRGGMGVVYEAVQESMERRVALKVLYPTIATTVRTMKRFEREARVTGRLHHTNIVTVHAMGRDAGYVYFAMELIEGQPLDRVIEHLGAQERGDPTSEPMQRLASDLCGRGRFERMALKLAGVADALHVAHAHGVIHRDVKPSNLVLDGDGDLKLTDFGLAQLVGADFGVTRTGEILGTPMYMSPEQVRARREDVDQRTDVYSLGATLYELLTLTPVHDGKDLGSLCSQILTEDPRALGVASPQVPKDLATIVHKALQKQRGDRYPTAGEMAADLRAFAEGRAIRARRLGIAQRSWRTIKRRRVRSALVAMVVLLAGVGIWLKVDADRAREQKREAEYHRLLREAYMAGVPLGRPEYLDDSDPQHALYQAHVSEVERIFSRAIALAPERTQPWLGRALTNGRDEKARLADLEAAATRGLSARTLRLARGYILRDKSGTLAGLGSESEQPTAIDFFLAGWAHSSRGDRERGIELFGRAMAEDTAHDLIRTAALRMRALAHGLEGNWTSAIEDLATLRGVGRSPPSAVVSLANAWRVTDHAEKAESTFHEALTLVKKTPGEYQWGQFLALTNRTFHRPWIDAAHEAAVSADLTSPSVRHYLVTHFAKRDPQLSLSLSAKTLLLAPPGSPHHLMAMKSRTVALIAAGQSTDARRLTLELLADNPHDSLLLLWAVMRDCLDWEEARSRVARALVRAPEDRALITGMCALCLARGKHEELERWARRGLKLDSKNADSYGYLAVALTFQLKTTEALDAVERGLRYAPGHPRLITEKAKAQNNLGRYGEALATLASLGSVNGADLGSCHYIQGYAHEHLVNRELALEAYLKYAAAAPESCKAHIECARVFRHLGRKAEAAAALDKALACSATSALELTVRGFELLDQGRFELARKDAESLRRLAPKHAVPPLILRILEALEPGFVPRTLDDYVRVGGTFHENAPAKAYECYARVLSVRSLREGFREALLLVAASTAAMAMVAEPSEPRQAEMQHNALARLREWRDLWHARVRSKKASGDAWAAKDAETQWKNWRRIVFLEDPEIALLKDLPAFKKMFAEELQAVATVKAKKK